MRIFFAILAALALVSCGEDQFLATEDQAALETIVELANPIPKAFAGRRPHRTRRPVFFPRNAMPDSGEMQPIWAWTDTTSIMGVIGYGQSNCYGSGSTAQTTVSPASDIYRMADGATWPLDAAVEGTGTGGTGHDNETIGTLMAEMIRSLDSDNRMLAVAEECNPGALMEQIEKSGTGSEYFVAFQTGGIVEDSFNAADGNEVLKIGAIVFSHAHGDSRYGLCGDNIYNGGSPSVRDDGDFDYDDRLYDLCKDAEADIQLATGQTESVACFFVANTSFVRQSDIEDHRSACALASYRLSKEFPGEFFHISPEGHWGDEATNLVADGVHFGNTGMQLMNEDIGKAIASALGINGTGWLYQSLTPNDGEYGITVSTTNVSIDISDNIPCRHYTTGACSSTPYTTIDTTNKTAAWTGFKGLELHCFDEPRPPYFTSQPTLDANGEIISITTDREIPPIGCSICAGVTGYPNSYGGNGTGSGGKGRVDNNFRSTGGPTGVNTTQVLHDWMAPWCEPISGSGTNNTSIATLTRDRHWDLAYEMSDTECPAASSAIDATIGGASLDLAYVNGTWACDSATGGSAAKLGDAFNEGMNFTTASCWETNDQTFFPNVDFNEGEALRFRWVGQLGNEAGTITLVDWRDDDFATDSEQFRVQITAAGTVSLTVNTRDPGVNWTTTLGTAVPDTEEDAILDIILFNGADSNNNAVAIICYNGNCVRNVNGGGSFGSIGGSSGDLALGCTLSGTLQATEAQLDFVGISVGAKAFADWFYDSWDQELFDPHIEDYKSFVFEDLTSAGGFNPATHLHSGVPAEVRDNLRMPEPADGGVATTPDGGAGAVTIASDMIFDCDGDTPSSITVPCDTHNFEIKNCEGMPLVMGDWPSSVDCPLGYDISDGEIHHNKFSSSGTETCRFQGDWILFHSNECVNSGGNYGGWASSQTAPVNESIGWMIVHSYFEGGANQAVQRYQSMKNWALSENQVKSVGDPTGPHMFRANTGNRDAGTVDGAAVDGGTTASGVAIIANLGCGPTGEHYCDITPNRYEMCGPIWSMFNRFFISGNDPLTFNCDSIVQLTHIGNEADWTGVGSGPYNPSCTNVSVDANTMNLHQDAGSTIPDGGCGPFDSGI